MAAEVAAAPVHHLADADGYRIDGGWQARRYVVLLVEGLPPAEQAESCSVATGASARLSMPTGDERDR
jgi:hypothetical protein